MQRPDVPRRARLVLGSATSRQRPPRAHLLRRTCDRAVRLLSTVCGSFQGHPPRKARDDERLRLCGGSERI
eukprot:scaffold4493_cov390-Prasinococcus_capsulatus_cf.AAC.1